MSRIIVCGGRDYDDEDFVWSAIDKFHKRWPVTLVIHGDATGADAYAANWAYFVGVQQARFPVTDKVWDAVGKSAGPIRNRLMLELNPAAVLAFPGNTGTQDMIQAAMERGVTVHRCGWGGGR